MRIRKGTVICPRCRSAETLPVRTGWPEPEPGQTLPRQDTPPFARLLGVDHIDRVCRKCGHQWQVRRRRRT